MSEPHLNISPAVEKRLREEQVIWLTTVTSEGMPLPTPVWFLWEGDAFLIYTLANSVKLNNIAQNPHASLNLNSDEYGDKVVVFTGEIQIAKDVPPADQNQAYIAKYREGLADLKMTPAGFAGSYSVPLRMVPTHLRA
ncbi:MAG: TIGR03667 family PPOX class F420-dependent oxidoreductase [Chloroflexi bacterium]|nr:TIGR03667 family PPOX class F420-dependent oxidoreductase [Chloroflexota bacterium]